VKILFVANAWSIHTARWINQISSEGWDIHIFPSRDLQVNPLIRNVTVHDLSIREDDLHPSVITPGAGIHKKGFRSLLRRFHVIDQISRPIPPGITSFDELNDYARIQGRRLASLIRNLKPDLVHSLQFQYDSYPTLEAKKLLGNGFPKWIVSNWGADIHYFGQFSDHAEKIREVLAQCNYYSCECHRDIDLAHRFGYQGPILPVIPNTGGYDLEWVTKLRMPGATSERKIIAVKGYKDWVYRGLVALDALKQCRDLILDNGYILHIYLGGKVMEDTASSYGLPYQMIPYSPHEEILKLHGRSRVSIGLSLSDAISTSFLEAIVMGSFPIQSFTSCAGEWVRDGESGFLVPPEDPDAVAVAIREALTNDHLVDNAAKENWVTVKNRLDNTKIRPLAIEFYRGIN